MAASVFDAPYYGKSASSQRWGLCHAADCELLDTLLLTETKKKIVYTEHYYPRMEQTLARFNSWYIGGIAHELGHGLGLDHDAGNPDEDAFGTSLMGGEDAVRPNAEGAGATDVFFAAGPRRISSSASRERREGVAATLRKA